MATYTGAQAIFNAALGNYYAVGFRLAEPDDHTLILFYKGERIAVFGIQEALIPAIHEACQGYLDRQGIEAS